VVAAIKLASTNIGKAIVPICLIRILSDDIPLPIKQSAIRDQLLHVQGTENGESKSREQA